MTNLSHRYLSLSTKVRVCQTLVLPIFVYMYMPACEIWTLLVADTKKTGSLSHEMPTPYAAKDLSWILSSVVAAHSSDM